MSEIEMPPASPGKNFGSGREGPLLALELRRTLPTTVAGIHIQHDEPRDAPCSNPHVRPAEQFPPRPDAPCVDRRIEKALPDQLPKRNLSGRHQRQYVPTP